MDYDDRQELWQSRMREVFCTRTVRKTIYCRNFSHVRIEYVMFQLQGSIIIASVFEVIIGFTGVIGLLMRFIGPLTIVPTISLTGLSLFGVASFWASKHWGIAVLYVRRCFIMISNYINESELFLLTWKFSPG